MLVWVLLVKVVFVVQLGIVAGEPAPATAGLSSVGEFSSGTDAGRERESSFRKRLATENLTTLQWIYGQHKMDVLPSWGEVMEWGAWT